MKKLLTLQSKLFEKGITRTRLSKETGILRWYITLALRGRYCFDEEEQLKIAKVLNEPPTQLFPELQQS